MNHKDISEDIFKRNWVMDRAYARDDQGNVYYGEQLLIAMLLKVKKAKNRTDEQVAELEEIIKKPKRRNRR